MKRIVSNLFVLIGILLVSGSVANGTKINLILNPGFEDWTDSLPDEWYVTTTNGGKVYADTIPETTYYKYVVLSTSPGSPGPKPFDEAILSQKVDSLDTNSTYQLSFWYKVNDILGPQLRFQWLGVDSLLPHNGAQWGQVFVEDSALSDTTTLKFILTDTFEVTSNTVRLDNVRMIKVDPIEEIFTEDFDTFHTQLRMPKDWWPYKINGNVVVDSENVVPPHLQTVVCSTSYYGWLVGLFQVVDSEIDSLYHLEFDYQVYTDAGTLKVGFANWDTVLVLQDTSWITYEKDSLSASSTSSRLWFHIKNNQGSAKTKVWLDNIKLTRQGDSTNLITNGDFEDTTWREYKIPEGWTLNTLYDYADLGMLDSTLEMRDSLVTDYIALSRTNAGTLYKDTVYTLSLWCKSDQVGRPAELGTIKNPEESPPLLWESLIFHNIEHQDWKQAKILFRPSWQDTTETTTQLWLSFHVRGVIDWHVWLDSLTVVKDAMDIQAPLFGKVTADNSPTFQWENVRQGTNSFVDYTLEWARDTSFTIDADRESLITFQDRWDTLVAYTFPEPVGNGDWYWRVKANIRTTTWVEEPETLSFISDIGLITIDNRGEDRTPPIITAVAPYRSLTDTLTLWVHYEDDIDVDSVQAFLLSPDDSTLNGIGPVQWPETLLVDTDTSCASIDSSFFPTTIGLDSIRLIMVRVYDGSDESPTAKTWPLIVKGAPSDSVWIDDDNRTHISQNGGDSLFFPIGLYSVRDDDLDDIGTTAFNMVQTYNSNRSYLDTLYLDRAETESL